ncbi:methyltransferase domain-containing protein [Brachybacterium sp. EF45031]|uniref:methyltransferase domain-containing protein n=1 Tax=Brachybacterium sillae TaxID=2810536 RepID=UPI00217D8EFD|nr:methyltransferase domain-containing protein [Brachybacterium sillae]MCS6710626.1 methyltransferase domain-containing protein [Brachybacterium sillae]
MAEHDSSETKRDEARGGASSEVLLEVLEGCREDAAREASALGAVQVLSPTELRLHTDDLAGCRTLRRVVTASLVSAHPARRPRELLATPVQQQLDTQLQRILTLRPRVRFSGVRIEAAGADSPDMRRLAEAIGDLTGLPVVEDGDLRVRVRPRPGEHGRWEMLLRLTPRPLSARAWRTIDYPGAVNATIAASVLDRLQVGADDVLLDPTCGSGTFLIEQLHDVAPRRTVGVDLSATAIDAAQQHQRAARRRGRIDWIVGDAREVTLENGVSRVVMNPPWGMLHGEHGETEALYRDLLERMAQLCVPGARLALLTQEVRRTRALIDDAPAGWRMLSEHRYFQKGHRPALFLLER